MVENDFRNQGGGPSLGARTSQGWKARDPYRQARLAPRTGPQSPLTDPSPHRPARTTSLHLGSAGAEELAVILTKSLTQPPQFADLSPPAPVRHGGVSDAAAPGFGCARLAGLP